jgi:hypothetical protein
MLTVPERQHARFAMYFTGPAFAGSPRCAGPPRPAGVYGDTRLQIYFHPDDGCRNLLFADPFVIFESPQQAAAAGYRLAPDPTSPRTGRASSATDAILVSDRASGPTA